MQMAVQHNDIFCTGQYKNRINTLDRCDKFTDFANALNDFSLLIEFVVN